MAETKASTQQGSETEHDKTWSFTLYNAPDKDNATRKTYSVSNEASKRFIEAIREATAGGYGFVPFIGAGFSVSAGVPIITQLATYLKRCICMALALEEDGYAPWNPRTDQWPPFIDRGRNDGDEHWEDLLRTKFEAAKAKSKKDKSRNHNLGLYQEAFGAMAEWRTSLSSFPSNNNVATRQRDTTPNRSEASGSSGSRSNRRRRRNSNGQGFSIRCGGSRDHSGSSAAGSD